MKKMINRSLFLLAGLAFVFASCGKYEGGPGLSLLTKKGRLAGTWDANSIEYSNGNVITIDPNTVNLTFEKDGTFIGSYVSIPFPGTWEFNEDKSSLFTISEAGDTTEYDPIYRLTSKELWFKDSDGDITKYSKK
jgi:Lipocalin-like domain